MIQENARVSISVCALTFFYLSHFFFRDVAGFIGPEGSNCATEAMVAGSKNKAMISYRCSDAEITSQEKFPTFTRMEPPDTQVRNSNTGSKNQNTFF